MSDTCRHCGDLARYTDDLGHRWCKHCYVGQYSTNIVTRAEFDAAPHKTSLDIAREYNTLVYLRNKNRQWHRRNKRP